MFTRCVSRSGRARVSRSLSMFLAAGAAVSASLLASQARAQYVWTGGATGSWSATGNWLNSTPPVSGTSTSLTFSPGNNAAAITSTQDIAATFVANAMTLNAMSMTNALTIAGSGSNVFQIGGTSPTITLRGSGNTTVSSPMTLAADLRFSGSGMGNAIFSGAISGPQSLTIANTSPTQGSGFVQLSSSTSNFSGGVTLDGGKLLLGGSTSGLGTGAFTVTSNGGVLQPASGTVTPAVPTMTLNGQLRVQVSSVSLNIGATTLLQGSGPLLITGNVANAMTVSSSSTSYTGAVTIDRFDLPQMFSNPTPAGLQLTNTAGALGGVTTYNVRAGGTLWANNAASGATANQDRIANAATINFASGILQVAGTGTSSAAQSNVTEVVGTVNGSGYSTLTSNLSSGGTKSTVINVNSGLNRVDRGTFLFRGASLGAGTLSVDSTNGDSSQNFAGTASTSYIVVPAATSAGLAGGGGAAGSKTISILPYAVGDTASSGTGTGTTWVTLDAISGSTSLNVRPLAAAEYATDLVTGPMTNAQLSAATANTGLATVNSLILSGAGGSVTGSGTLNITSGSLLACTSAATSISNALAFGAAEGQIFTSSTGTGSTLTISGNMTGTGGLTKSGTGSASTLVLTGDNSGLTGQLTVNSGAINFNSANALPGTGQIVTRGANVLSSGTSYGANTALLYSGTNAFPFSRDIAAKSGWLTLKTLDTGTGGSMTVSGQISGDAGVALQPSSTTDIWISRTDNAYTGPTAITTSGTSAVHIASDGSLGNGGALNLAGTLMLEGDWTTARHINNGGMTINTNGHNAVLNGPMTNFLSGFTTSQSNTAVFNKTGAGTLTITSNANALGGPINVNGGTMLVNGTIAGSTASAVSVASAATLGGSGAIYRNISVALGGTLSPGSSPGVLTEYGNLSLASGSNFAVDLNGPTPGNSAANYDQMVVNGTVTLTGSSLAFSLGYFPAATDRFFTLTDDGADAITGTFSGLAEGATVNLGTWGGTPVTATISYLGDSASGLVPGDAGYISGNDVVLYNLVPAPGAICLLSLGGIAAFRRRRR